MKRRTPLKAKRDRPRRDEGRVKHGRSKPRRGAGATKEQNDYHRALRRDITRCEACMGPRDLVLHHILAEFPEKSGRRDEWYVIILCAGCHNIRTDSVHLLGSEVRFHEVHKATLKADLVTISIARLRLWLLTGSVVCIKSERGDPRINKGLNPL